MVANIEASLITEFAQRVDTSSLKGAALVGVERLTGSDLDDELTGSNTANKLVGGAGADTLLGLGEGHAQLPRRRQPQ